MKFTKSYSLLIIVSIVFAACKNNAYDSSIPNAPIYIRLDLSFHATQLNAPNENACFTEIDVVKGVRNIGYGGVLIHSSPTSNINNLTGVDYSAFDMACPYEVDKTTRILPDESGMYAICEKCGSKFELTFGQIATKESLAKEILKRYNISRSGNFLIVTQRYN